MLRKVTVSAMVIGLMFIGANPVQGQLEFGTPEKLGPNINTDGHWEARPSLSYDGLELFFNSDPGDTLYSAKRDSREGEFGPRQIIRRRPRGPSVSSDGLSLYYDYVTGGRRTLCVMTRDAIDADWSEGQELGSTVNSSYNDLDASISGDGLELYFSSDRPGEGAGTSIWVTKRNTINSDWQEPVELGPHINATSYDRHPDISADGLTLFFASLDRAGGFGSTDLWMATRETIDSPWVNPVNLGPDINTAQMELGPHLSADGSEFYFSRGRNWDADTLDLWRVPVILPPSEDALQAGDADQNCSFDQLDLVRVLQADKYLSGDPATWGEGDWNGAPSGSPGDPPAGDGLFDQLDIIAALSAGMYLQGSYCADGELTAFAVPEPSTFLLLSLGLTVMLPAWPRKRQSHTDNCRENHKESPWFLPF